MNLEDHLYFFSSLQGNCPIGHMNLVLISSDFLHFQHYHLQPCNFYPIILEYIDFLCQFNGRLEC